MKHIIKITAIAISAIFMLTSCGTAGTKTPSAAQSAATAVPSATHDPTLTQNTKPITITLTTGEVIKAELYPDIAPITVENFEKLVNEHFYDGLIFHRVIAGFMIQGGGYDANMQQHNAASIKGEFSANGIENNLSHTRGVLSMARTPDMDSASSQFFIMHEDSTQLDGKYAAFGKVTEGLEVVDRIAETKTNSNDAPLEPIVIQSIELN